MILVIVIRFDFIIVLVPVFFFFFFKQKTAYEMRISDWSSDVCSSDLNLIWPLFVCDGSGSEEPVASLPGVSRWSVDLLVERARDAVAAGIPCLALFPYTQADRRSADGGEALNPDNLMCRATTAIKQALGDDIGVLTDVALDPYTSHGDRKSTRLNSSH